MCWERWGDGMGPAAGRVLGATALLSDGNVGQGESGLGGCAPVRGAGYEDGGP